MNQHTVAVIATGMMGQQHIEAIHRIPGFRVAALVGSNPETLRSKAEQLGVDQIFTDYRQMVEQVHPDIVHNCTPNGLHYEINKYLLNQGIHVYCEKPLAITVEQGEELIHLAEQNHVAAGVNFNYRNNAMVQEMRERVANGSVGRVFHVTGQYLQDWMLYDTDYNWRLTSDLGGASRTIADIGSHWFDTAQCILGKKIAAVRAETIIVHPFRKKPEVTVQTFSKAENGEYTLIPVSTEDAAFITLRFDDGTIGTVNVSQVCGGHLNDLRIEVAGEKCSLTWKQECCDSLTIGTREFGQQTVKAAPGSLSGAANRYTRLPGGHPDGWADALRNAIAEFYASINNGSFAQQGMSYATFADAVQIMKIVQACLESAKTGCWVHIL